MVAGWLMVVPARLFSLVTPDTDGIACGPRGNAPCMEASIRIQSQPMQHQLASQ